MEIVAEGIERVDQLGRLRELGCQFGQGYYFARPLDAYGIEALLAAEDGRWAPASVNLIPFNPQARSSVG
jgi:EAL domain-containing protein (putative c-di-GMP-specific phosphodiesterase class I)